MTRVAVRVAAVVAAFLLSRQQFQFFDCNKMPALSVMSGTITLLLLYATAEVAFRVFATSSLSTSDKPAALLKVVLIGGSAVALTGFFTMMTHLCP